MTDHLPECHLYEHDDIGHFDESECDKDCVGPCICDRLRACQERVAKEYRNREMNGLAWMDGYDHGVDAAREAVEQVSSLLQPLGPALAAIDALRGES